jgi:tetratricopeptide (TPR) repeat protein
MNRPLLLIPSFILCLVAVAPPLRAQAQQGEASQAQTQQGQQAQAQGQQRNFKDRAEYDLYDSILKETAPAKRLELLNTWKAKYPNTDFNKERLLLYLSTYQQLGRAQEMLDTAKQILAIDPKDPNGLLWVTVLTVSTGTTAPDALTYGEQAAKTALGALDEIFALDKKPKEISESDWNKQKNFLQQSALNMLGWAALQRKDWTAAEQYFTKSLQVEPNQGQVSYWLGTAILGQRNPDKQSAGLYHIARAVAYSGPGEAPAQLKTQLDQYLTKVYSNFHGSAEGLNDIKQLAAKSPFPPADFKIKSQAEIFAEQEEKLKKENPMLALWLSLKRELTGPNGEQYFQNMKDSLLPGNAVPGVTKFRGKLISQNPANRPKELVVGIADANTPEVTLRFQTPLPGRAEPGTELAFEGVAKEFTKDPFNLVLEVEREQLEGWPATAPAKAKPAPAKSKARPRARKR